MPKIAHKRPVEWLVEHFGAVQSERRFAWVLGAGASRASRIPLGSQLVDNWLQEMHSWQTKNPNIESWATAENLGIKYFNWDERASFYSQVYQRRFEVIPKDGYDYLEGVMANKEPSPGYSILAVLMARGRHNVVITTNFDNLVADAISIYTDALPLVIGHESLAGFIDESRERPLICKIHRDLLLNPQNDSRSLVRLHDSWGPALRNLFRNHSPFFIGYGGNDATLMGLLESLEPRDIRPGLIWCHYEEEASERIRELVAELDGTLVRVPDFDLLMIMLGHKIGITTLDSEIGKRAGQRTRSYQDRMIQLDLSGHPFAASAVAATMERSAKWWKEYRKTQTETDPKKRKVAFESAIKSCPKSAVLLGLYANFMRDTFGDFKAAAKMYHEALLLDRFDATITGDSALLADMRGQNYEAERLYKEALKLDPNNATITNNFANFLWYVRELPLSADSRYRRAAKLDPTSAEIAVDFATFLWNFVGSFSQAAVAYRNALSLDPKGARTLTSYAGFRLSLEYYDEALSMIKFARSMNGREPNQLAAILWFYEAIILTINRRDNSTALEELTKVLNQRFRRQRWKFDRVLDLVKITIPDRDDFFSNLGARILNAPLELMLEEWLADIDD